MLVLGSAGSPPGAAFRRDWGLAPQGWPQTGCGYKSSGPSLGSVLLSASLEGECFLPSSGHQAAACHFSGHSLLNCVPIERNTITLRLEGNCEHLQSAFLFNTSWSVFSGEDWKAVFGWRMICTAFGSIAGTGMVSFVPLQGEGRELFLFRR